MTDHFNTAPGMPQSRAEVNRLDNDTLNDFMGRCGVEPADFDNCLACYAYQVAQLREAEEATPLWREPGGYRSTCPVCKRLVVDHHGAEAWECLDKMGKVWNDVDHESGVPAVPTIPLADLWVALDREPTDFASYIADHGVEAVTAELLRSVHHLWEKARTLDDEFDGVEAVDG